MYARATKSNGYISLALTFLLIVLALLPISERFESNQTAVGLVTLASAIILGVRGTRIGHGKSRCAAWVSLGILLLWVVVTFVVSGINIVAESNR